MTTSKKDDFTRVLEILEYKIVAGILNPRERLIERELSEEYSISIGTVRKILKELTVQNLIKHVSNRGAIVTEPTPKEVADIYHTRMLLENHAIDSVISNMIMVQLEKIQACEARFEEGLVEKNLRKIISHNRLFHQLIFEMCGNTIISEMISQLRNRSRTWYHYIRGNTQQQENSIKDHRMMIHCLKTKDNRGLKEINKTHLTAGYENYKESLLLS